MKVLDAEGRELRPGAKVRRPLSNMVGTYHGIDGRRKSVAVEFLPDALRFFPAERDSLLRRTYRVPQLLRAEDSGGEG